VDFAIENETFMKILISDTAPLYPPLWGGPKRIWGLYSNFSQDLFDITYVGVKANLENGLKYSFNKIRDNFKEISCAFPPHYYFWHAFEKMVFRDTSLDLFTYLWMHTDWHFKYILDSQNADMIICSHPWSSLSIHKKRGQFFIYDAHNCEYMLMDQILGRHAFKKLILQRTRKIEEDACKKSDLILACSDNEKKDLMNLYKIRHDKIIVVTNGAYVREKAGQAEKENSRNKLDILSDEKVIIFIGAYYKPNIDAARFIIENLAPELKEFIFFIVGAASAAFKEAKMPPNIKLLGRLTDERLDAALRASDMAINPMFDGSGINIKMLDYMSYGLPIVTTQVGARGIEIRGKKPMIVSTVDNFAENIKILNNDSQLYKRISEDGQSLVIQHYDWKIISSKLQDEIIQRLR
jgi:glycosyltransferase involved in cell wall biosynthesis